MEINLVAAINIGNVRKYNRAAFNIKAPSIDVGVIGAGIYGVSSVKQDDD
ncbi:hypothetical protein [Acetobacter ascendens]|nr:hypothetical protein [Acetobacter ascendens]